MNKIVVLGRLTKDPEVRYTPSQKVVCSFTLAVDRDFKNPETGEREADFIPVVVWGKTAELCGNSLAKGHRLLVEGRLQIRNFDGKDGNRRWVSEIVASRIEFVERRADVQGSQKEASKPMAPEPSAPPAPAQPAVQQKAAYRPQTTGSYTKQAPKASSAGKYTPVQKGGYQRQNTGAVSPFDEEVPF